MPRHTSVPGSIYLNGNRYWWIVRLPTDDRRKARPLKPTGARFATRDPTIAESVAREMWREAVAAAARQDGCEDLTLAVLTRKYIDHCRLYYRNADGRQTGEAANIELAVRPLADRWPILPAADFEVRHLLEFRGRLVSWPRQGAADTPPLGTKTKTLARTTVNKRVAQIIRMFKWAGGERQLVPVWVWRGLTVIEPLKPGRSRAIERSPVGAVEDWIVEATLPFMPPVVQAMVRLQRLTGMRSGELCQMMPGMIERSGDIWFYEPRQHKGRHRGKRKVIPLGPQAQAILEPLLAERLALGPVGAAEPLFSPAEAQRQRNVAKHAKRKSKVQPSLFAEKGEKGEKDRRKADPQVQPGNQYDRRSYYKAVQYAIAAANRAREQEALIAKKDTGCDVRVTVPHWHPHQLRHAAASRITEEADLKAAAATLGHDTLAMTEHYARAAVERIKLARAIDVARKLG